VSRDLMFKTGELSYLLTYLLTYLLSYLLDTTFSVVSTDFCI